MTETAPARQGFLARLAPFSRDFWVINVIELFERGAFYSVVAVLAVYLTLQRGIEPGIVGAVLGSLFYLNYFIPLVSAPFSEKYGYKAGLAVSFAAVGAGYATLMFASSVTGLVAGVLLVGFGAGVFKPLAAALIGQTTTEDQRTFGFVLYYMFVNIGAFLFPLLVGLAGLWNPGWLNPAAFGVGVGLAALNLVLSLVVFRNVRAPQRQASVLASLRPLVEVFREWRLGLLVVIYTGFWILYAMNQSWLAVYMVEFGRMPAEFNAAFLTTLLALGVIVGAPIVGFFQKGKPALPSMAVGIALFVTGFVVMSFSSGPALFVLGVLLFCFGEVATHPAYLSYVAGLAPPGKDSVYLGFSFLAIGAGYTIGTSAGGVLYGRFAQDSGQPTLFWAVMASVGLVTLALLLLYNRFLAPGRAATSPRMRIAGPIAAAVALLLVPGLVASAMVVDGEGRAAPILGGGGALAVVALADQAGNTAEGDASEATFTLPTGAKGNATFTLTWADEAGGAGTTNQPDTFKVQVQGPGGISVQSADTPNPAGGEGEIVVSVPAVPGVYTVTVRLTQAGDQVVQVGPIPVAAGQQPDAGNDWVLAAAYEAPR